MKNITLNLTLLFLFFSPYLSAQIFTESIQSPLLSTVSRSSFDFADIDGDNDQDLLLTGLDDQNDPSVKLYINDGAGNFVEEVNIPFAGVYDGTVNFADIDGDNDPDVLITGAINIISGSSFLYRNDGAGNFTAATNTPFVPVQKGAVAFADIDGDNDLDLLVSGEDNLEDPISTLYENDGMGNFTEMVENPIFAIENGSVSFADVDGDNDLDLFILGFNTFFGNAGLYTNDGTGNFTLTATDFANPSDGSSGFVDVDGDNDPDLVITGFYSGVRETVLYINDGTGTFTEVEDPIFEGFTGSSLAFADVDEDGDNDILVTGDTNSSSSINGVAKLYTNDGLGTFTEVIDFPVEGVKDGKIGFVDVNGDGLQDVFIAGRPDSFVRNPKLYINETMVANENIAPLFFDLSLFPNPATTNFLNVNFTATTSGTMTLKIFDTNGRLLIDQKASINIGEQTMKINIRDLATGNYILQLSDETRQTIKKFIVE